MKIFTLNGPGLNSAHIFLRYQGLRGFLVVLLSLASSISYAEDAGTKANSHTVPGPVANTSLFAAEPKSLRTNLYLLNDNNTTRLADGVLTEYDDQYHDSVTVEDAYKLTNVRENFGIERHGATLMIERRPLISSNDTVFYKLWKTTMRNYQLEFIPTGLENPCIQAFLQDAYLGTTIPVRLNGTTKFNFSVNADTLSAKANRFRIIYETNFATLPVNFTGVRAYETAGKIAVEWKVENEMNIENYEVQRSVNGSTFVKLASVPLSKQNSTYTGYSWTDNNPSNGTNFYRIRSVDRDGSGKFSPIVKVEAEKTSTGNITIYPNPIRGGVINLLFTNQSAGTYQVRLISNSGQVMFKDKLVVNSNNYSTALFTNKKLPKGVYQLETRSPDNQVSLLPAIVQD